MGRSRCEEMAGMANRPEPKDSYRLGEGERKVVYAKDTKIPNAGTFTINKEDHTLGNLLRMCVRAPPGIFARGPDARARAPNTSRQLLRDKQVRFAGYQLPHPLEHRTLVKIQTVNATPTPVNALSNAINDLFAECDLLDQRFKEEVRRVCSERGQASMLDEAL